MPHSPSSSVPILRDVDVLVLGSPIGAVAAALEAKRLGRTVMAVADFSYFGSDVAGTYQLWAEGWDATDPLLGAILGDEAGFPLAPAAVKAALEGRLVEAGVPFLFHSRAVSLLRDAEGHLAGAILAARTSLLAVTCRAIIDASEHGSAVRLAGMEVVPRESVPPRVEWTVLARQAPQNWPGEAEEIRPHFRQVHRDGVDDYPAFRLKIDRALLGHDPAAAEHVVRSLLVDENVFAVADVPVTAPLDKLAGGVERGLADLSDADLQPAPGLWMAGGLLPLTPEGSEALRHPNAAVALGRRVGALAAQAGAKRGGALPAQPSASETGDFRFAPAFLRESTGALDLGNLAFPRLGAFDVVVAGGGTGGAPAGIAAGRAGASSLVIEMQHGLGGVGTLGLVSVYWFGNKVGFTAELNATVEKVDSRSRAKKGNVWTPEVKTAIYHRLLQQAGGRAWLGSYAFGVRMEGNRVTGLLVSTPFGAGLVEAGGVVDATGNADIAAAAGAPCRVIDASHVAVQGTGLSPRQHPGVRQQNSDHTFVDETDPEGITCAFVHARAKYPGHFDTTPMVDSRERRQILGECELSPLDLLAGRTFPDTVFTACSNFDTHGFTIHPVFMVTAPDHKALHAHVPFRAMLPCGVEGVLVTGLGMSAHRDALPVIRMQADVQNQGYVAGLALAEAAAKHVPLRALDIRALQRRLVEVGILDPAVPTHEDSFPMTEEAVRAAAAGDFGQLKNIAILLAHPEASRGPVLEVMRAASEPRRSDAALILGLMGVPEAAPVLEEAVRTSPWDDGWNYKGMGQFGCSMSRLDAMIIGLARCGSTLGIDAIAEKISSLGEDAQFSHCRAVALAVAALPDPRLTVALAGLLAKPGLQGHAWLDLARLRAGANGDQIETQSRNDALREIYLARGLYLAGDPGGVGQRVLSGYAKDLRGHFARHARAVLETGANGGSRHALA